MTKSEYVGYPRNAEERQLSALPLEVLLDYADAIMADPGRLELIRVGWNKKLTASWTDEQNEELGRQEKKFAVSFLTMTGYGGLYNRHFLALGDVCKAVYAYTQAPDGEIREFVRKRLADSDAVKENYSNGDNS